LAVSSLIFFENCAHYEHNSRTDTKAILAFIAEELEARREPLLPDVAARFGITVQSLSKSLSARGTERQRQIRSWTRYGDRLWRLL